MAVAEIGDGSAFIELDVPQRELPLIKQIPGHRFNSRSQRWRVPLSWAACKQLRGVFGDRLHIGHWLESWAWDQFETARLVRAARDRSLDPEATLPGSDSRLYPFQQTGVQFLQLADSAILGDDMGLGKTPQSLVAVQHWPLLVVTKKTVRGQWDRSVEEWTEGEAVVLDGSIAARRKILAEFSAAYSDGGHGALIVNWEQLPAHSRLAPYGSVALSDKERLPKEFNEIAWGTVIADEAHKAKDPKAKQTRALWAVGDAAKARYALTGSPREGSLADFWALLRFVAPHEWPSKTGFVDRYCVKDYNWFGGLEIQRLRADTEDEFRELIETRFLRRPKSLVAPWLPEKVRTVRHVEMGAKQAKVYKHLKDEFVAALDAGGEVVAFSDLTKNTRLLQITAAMLEETELGEYRMVEPSPKLDELEAILDELDDKPAAVFSASRQLLRLAEARLSKAGITYGVIAGDIPRAACDTARDDYNAGRVRVLLISLGAGAEGLNLARGQYEIFIDRHGSHTANAQAEDRMHGIGRGDKDAEAITIVDIIVKGTVDEGRLKAYAEKGEDFEHLVRDKEAVKRLLEGEV